MGNGSREKEVRRGKNTKMFILFQLLVAASTVLPWLLYLHHRAVPVVRCLGLVGLIKRG